MQEYMRWCLRIDNAENKDCLEFLFYKLTYAYLTKELNDADYKSLINYACHIRRCHKWDV